MSLLYTRTVYCKSINYILFTQIWVTAGKNGLKTGVYFWPGSEAKIQGRRPDYYYTYNRETSFEERFQTVLTWLDLPQSLRWVVMTYM